MEITWLCCVHGDHLVVLCTWRSLGCVVCMKITWLCCVHGDHLVVLCTWRSLGCVVYMEITWLCCVHGDHLVVLCVWSNPYSMCCSSKGPPYMVLYMERGSLSIHSHNIPELGNCLHFPDLFVFLICVGVGGGRV